jgi:hypothetical protein
VERHEDRQVLGASSVDDVNVDALPLASDEVADG